MPFILFTDVVVFLFGLGIGSFLNVLVIRGYAGESLKGRSYCRSCKNTLSPKELIPVFSYLLQKGRCRSCGTAFSSQYALVEFTTALCFVVVFNLSIPKLYFLEPLYAIPLTLALLVQISALVYIFVADLKYQIIPNGPIILLGLWGIAEVIGRFLISNSSSDVFYDIISALSIGLLFASLWAVSKGKWMGFGDVKLIVPTSLILGFPASLNAFLFAFWLGGLTGIILIVLQRKKLQSHIPFGPFIIVGAILAYLWGPKLIFLGTM